MIFGVCAASTPTSSSPPPASPKLFSSKPVQLSPHLASQQRDWHVTITRTEKPASSDPSAPLQQPPQARQPFQATAIACFFFTFNSNPLYNHPRRRKGVIGGYSRRFGKTTPLSHSNAVTRMSLNNISPASYLSSPRPHPSPLPTPLTRFSFLYSCHPKPAQPSGTTPCRPHHVPFALLALHSRSTSNVNLVSQPTVLRMLELRVRVARP